MTEILKKRKIDRTKMIYILQFIIIAIPLMISITVPLPISKYTRAYHDFIETTPEGSVVGFNQQVAGASWPLLGSSVVRTTVRLWENDCKIIFFSMGAEAVPFTIIGIDEAITLYEERNTGKKIVYDEDYIVLGFISGEEMGFAALLSDIKHLIKKDYYEIPTNELNMLKTVNTGAEIPYMIWASAGSPSRDYVMRQYQTMFDGNLGMIVVTMILAIIVPYLNTGQIAGAIIGSSANAQYEALTGIVGPSLRLTNALSLVSLLVVAALIVGNIEFLLEKYRGGQK